MKGRWRNFQKCFLLALSAGTLTGCIDIAGQAIYAAFNPSPQPQASPSAQPEYAAPLYAAPQVKYGPPAWFNAFEPIPNLSQEVLDRELEAPKAMTVRDDGAILILDPPSIKCASDSVAVLPSAVWDKAVLGADGTSYRCEGNRVMRKSPSGEVSTLAGTETAGFSGDGSLALNAKLDIPSGLVLDGKGHLFVADSGNKRIRIVDLVSQEIASLDPYGSPVWDGSEKIFEGLRDVACGGGFLYVLDGKKILRCRI